MSVPDSPKPLGSPYLTLAEAREHFRCGVTKLRSLLKAGLPHLGEGKSTLILKQEAETWMAGRLTTAKRPYPHGKERENNSGQKNALMGVGKHVPFGRMTTTNAFTINWNEKEQCFIARVRDPKGGWKTKWLPKVFTQDQERQAQEHLIGWIASFYKNEPEAPVARIVPIKQAKSIGMLADKWLALKKTDTRVSHNYFRSLKRSLDCWLLDHKPAEGRKKIDHVSIENLNLETDFTVPVVRKWLASLKGKESSKLAFALALRTFFNDAIIQGWIDPEMVNPLDKPAVKDDVAKLRRVQKDERDDPNYITVLDGDQIHQLLNSGSLPDVRRMRYLLAVGTGLRDHELMGLTWGDIKTAKTSIPYLEVSRQLLKIGTAPANSGEKSAVTIPPKRGSYRSVPLHPLAVAALEHWKSIYVRHTGKQPENHMPIFARDRSPHGAKRGTYEGGSFTSVDNTVTLDRDCRDTGLPRQINGKNLHFHDLRHTFATQMAESGADEARIGRLLGHAKGSVARAHYIATWLPSDYEAVCKLDLRSVKFQALTLAAPEPVTPKMRLVKG